MIFSKKDAIIYCANLYDLSNKFRSLKINYNDFIDHISKSSYNMTDLGISSATCSKYLKILFPERVSQEKACTFLLRTYGLKYCSKCDFVHKLEMFFKNKNRITGTSSYCKLCDKECWGEWYNTNKPDHLSRVRNYRLRLARALPDWADLDKISVIYANRPQGYHVDHIIPLNGDNVCGLHVDNNLQYLTGAENLSKGNKFEIDLYQ